MPASSMCSITPQTCTPGGVAEGVDVDLDRVLQEPVDQHRPVGGETREPTPGPPSDPARPTPARRWAAQAVGVVADLHGAAAEHVGGADQDRVADPLGDGQGLLDGGRLAPGRGVEAALLQDRPEPAPVLGQVDGVGRGAEQRHPGRGQPVGQLEGVWPPMVTITPTRSPPAASARHTSSTSSQVSGST